MLDLVFQGKPLLLLVTLSLAVWSLSANVSGASSMDVVLVVDTSGSMAWDVEGRRKNDPKFQAPPRIDRVIDALKSYADKLPDGTRLRLISFNSGIKTNKEFTVSEANRGNLIATISQLKGQVGSGDTWLWEAMREGIKAAESYAAQDPDLTVTFYVLTDGEQDNKDPNREKDISLAKVLGASNALGGESLYGSLVLLGKRKSQGGAFRDEYLKHLKEEASTKCDVQLDEDFNPLFPAILDAPERALPGVKTKVYEVSGGNFSKVEWMLDGKMQPSQQRNLEFIPPKPGRYIVTFKGYDTKDRRARARIALDIGQTPVKAIPRISIDGKPFDSVDTIIQGQRMDLSHDSLGPVAKVTWNVNGNQTEAATLNSVLNRIGPYKISLTVESAPDPTGQITESTSQPIVFEVVAPRLMAQPEVSVDGKPLAEAGAIHPGAMLTLVSMNTANAQSFEWQVGNEKLSGQTLNWRVPSAGTFEIFHTVSGVASDDDVPQKDAAAPITITAVDPELTAVAEVLHNGKSYSASPNIYAGDTLQLVSKSTGPVESATWIVNGQEIAGNSVSWPIPAPGDIEILLKVQGQNPEQVDESLPLKVFTKKRPPLWALWAASIVGVFFLGLVWRFFIGNRPRLCRLESRLDPKSNVTLGRLDVAQYWNRLTKKARIPMGEAVASLKGRVIPPGPNREVCEFWAKEGAKHPTRCFEVYRGKDPKVPAVLDCPFKNFGGIDCSSDLSADRNNPRFVFNYPEAPAATKKVYFNFAEVGSATADKLALVGLTALILALFFLFVVKIYPMLS